MTNCSRCNGDSECHKQMISNDALHLTRAAFQTWNNHRHPAALASELTCSPTEDSNYSEVKTPK
jgi:hypothetical protein